MTQFSIKPALKGVKNADFSLKERLGSGGVASVYRERIGQQYYAIKIYTDASSFETKKIEFMIANPPPDLVREVAGIKYPRYAWPLALVRESGPSASPGVGYAMSVIDAKKSKTLDYFFDHNLSKSLENANSKALSFKIEILRNLSELIEELHELGHIFVDLKPQNVRVFEGTNIVTFLDCDGFTIGPLGGVECVVGAKSFRSTMVSPDYVAPEIMRRANRNDPIGVEQDEYALAVMIFQMLNNGIHPFQGVIKDSNTNAPTNDDKAAMGLYPHGITPNPRITHRPQSVHDTWLDETRFLLDRAFVAGNKRPTATEWKQHFDKILTQKLLVRCSGRPSDATHIRFRDKDCPACRRLQYRKAQPPPAPQASVPQNNKVAATPKSSGWEYWPAFVGVGFFILVIIALANATTPAPAPTPLPAVEIPSINGSLTAFPSLSLAEAETRRMEMAQLDDHVSAEIERTEHWDWVSGKLQMYIHNPKSENIDGMILNYDKGQCPTTAGSSWFLIVFDKPIGGGETVRIDAVMNDGPRSATTGCAIVTKTYARRPPNATAPSSNIHESSRPIGYASVYVSDLRAAGWASGYESQSSADAAARSTCEANTSSTENGTCKKLTGGQARCVAVAKSPHGAFGAAPSDTASRAKSDAIRICEEHATDESECVTPPGGVQCG